MGSYFNKMQKKKTATFLKYYCTTTAFQGAFRNFKSNPSVDYMKAALKVFGLYFGYLRIPPSSQSIS